MEQIDRALEFLQYAHEIVPGSVQVAVLALLGLGFLGGAFFLYSVLRKRRDRREREREELRLANLVLAAARRAEETEEAINAPLRPEPASPCDYCAGRRQESPAYADWTHLIADLRDDNVCVEHILRRCCGQAPPEPEPAQDEVEAGIAARVAAERARVYGGGSNPCSACRELP